MQKHRTTPKNYEAFKKIFSDYIESNNHRKTPERFSILKEVYNTEGHFDIESLYISMKNNNYRVSRATLYNTIELMRKCKLVIKHQFHNNVAQFEKSFTHQQHDHLLCSECEKVFEFTDPRFEEVQKSVEKHMSFKVNKRSVTFFGICKNCLKTPRDPSLR